MRVIVTGATGFVGSHLLNALATGNEVVCFLRAPEKIRSAENLYVVEGDLTDFQSYSRLPKRADAIMHLAQANVLFPSGANELFAVNAASSQWLAAYALRAGVSHFIYASSGSIYAPSNKALKETSAVQPSNYYALTKWFSERILECYKDYFHICILRLFAPYGPAQKNRMIPNILNSVRERRPVFITNGGQPLVNPIYIGDLIKMMVQALRLSGYHVVNVAGPDIVSVEDIAKMAGKLLGVSPIWARQKRADASNFIADTTIMRELFSPDELLGVLRGIQHVLESEPSSAQVTAEMSGL